MQIDLTSIIIVILVLSAFFIPVIIDQLHKRKHAIEKQFKAAAQKHHIKLDQYDIWEDNVVLGIDTKAKRVLYLSLKDTKKEALIDLNEVKRCALSRGKNPAYRIFLQFDFILPDKYAEQLEFPYNKEKSITLLEQTQKWEKLISSCIG